MPRARRNARKRITRYIYADASDPASPETGHTPRIPDETVVELPMDNGWTQALEVAKLPDEEQTVVVDMDPSVDPVLMWAGKRSHREVPVLPLQRTEIVSESRIARIIQRAREAAASDEPQCRQESLFAGLEKELRESDKGKRVEFYQHEEGWKNKLICGDSLQVIESLIRYEGLRGKVQMIYVDPPYGIKYNSNFQQRVDSTRNDEKDTADDVVSVAAFRDTWSLGVHSYLSYLIERLYLCRELISDTGSIFVQIGEDNLHRVLSVLDEVFGQSNRCGLIMYVKTSGSSSKLLSPVSDYLAWYAKDATRVKYRQLYADKAVGGEGATQYRWVESPDGKTRRRMTGEEVSFPSRIPSGWRVYALDNLTSQSPASTTRYEFRFEGKDYRPGNGYWKTTEHGMRSLAGKGRLQGVGNTLMYKRYLDDFPVFPMSNLWQDTKMTGFSEQKLYTVQTSAKVVARCIDMTTDPGDLVFDPTCGSGTTAYCAERSGRRWVTCDTSRVATNVARSRVLSAVYEHYCGPGDTPSAGFAYASVSRTTLKSVAYDLEAESIELRDRPEVDPLAIRVSGPFELMALGRYSIEDWRGQLVASTTGGVSLEDYVTVICRLYRRNASLLDSMGVIHAIEDRESEGTLGISVGPISGRVTARQLDDAAREAGAAGIAEVHVLGWAFEANVGEIRQRLAGELGVRLEPVMIRPDTLVEGLKVTEPGMLFSPLALPDVEIDDLGAGESAVTLKGVAVFDRRKRTTEYKHADSGYVAAWCLDEDYDGDCFVDCQMFFDFKKKPAVERTLKIEVDPEEWTLRLSSDPFKAGKYRRIAVKVVDVYGNESTVVKELG